MKYVLLSGLLAMLYGCGGVEPELGLGQAGKAEGAAADLFVARFNIDHKEVLLGVCNKGTKDSDPTEVAIYFDPKLEATRCNKGDLFVELPTAKPWKTIELGEIQPMACRYFSYSPEPVFKAVALVDPSCSLEDSDSSNNWALFDLLEP